MDDDKNLKRLKEVIAMVDTQDDLKSNSVIGSMTRSNT